MASRRLIAVWASLIGLAGCATIVDGSDQDIAFASEPPGASCLLTRDGGDLGRVTTPGRIKVSRSRKDIAVACEKEGFEPAKLTVESKVNMRSLGNLVIGGGIGGVIDSASGADREYEPAHAVALKPKASAPAETAAAP